MPTITPIRPEQVEEARRLIYTVAHSLFHPDRPLDEVVYDWESRRLLADLGDVQAHYFDNGGTFLVMTDETGRLMGTGALRRLDTGVGEIKRLWFWPEFWGQGLGYRMVLALFDAARAQGYRLVRLETDATRQQRALAFYHRLGFYDIPRYGDDPDEVALEIEL